MKVYVPLSVLNPGYRAIIHSIHDGPSYRRMLDMGLVPKTPLEVIRKAPFGDPIAILVRGFYLALRKAEASRIIVEVIDQVT